MLAHCFANVENPVMYEGIVDATINAYEKVWGIPSGN